MNSKQDFTTLVKQQKSTIYTVCYMFSNNKEEVDDLFQEVLTRLWMGWESFKGNSSPNTWVYRVALNTCISYERKKSKRHTCQLLEGVNLYDNNDVSNQQAEKLHRRITKLQIFDRAIVMLWLENLSYEEIGAIMGISAKNVSARLSRIREQLKKIKD